jgi:hypothetical protein
MAAHGQEQWPVRDLCRPAADQSHRHGGVWAVGEDGTLLHNRVERSSWELFQWLNEK